MRQARLMYSPRKKNSTRSAYIPRGRSPCRHEKLAAMPPVSVIRTTDPAYKIATSVHRLAFRLRYFLCTFRIDLPRYLRLAAGVVAGATYHGQDSNDSIRRKDRSAIDPFHKRFPDADDVMVAKNQPGQIGRSIQHRPHSPCGRRFVHQELSIVNRRLKWQEKN